MAKKDKFWFKAKRYGWGWYPSTWQGWLIIALYVLALLGDILPIDSAINFLSNVFVLTFFLLIICYKTGEKPRWRWGK